MPGSTPGPATYFGSLVSNWQKYVNKVLVNRLEGLILPRQSVVRLTDHPDMTLAVYHGCETTTQCSCSLDQNS